MRKLICLFFLLYSLVCVSQLKEVYIVSKMDGTFNMEDGTVMPFWGFGEYIPGGPERATLPSALLEFELGDSVIIHFKNASPEDHTIHLHGLDVNQVNDGVPATSVAVPANGTYDYHWKADHVGSFLYHCHVQTVMHSSLGMYGMIVVKNNPSNDLLYENGPGFSKEYNYLSSELYTYWNLNPISPGPFHLFDPDYFMINGKSGNQILVDESMIIDAQPGDSILLRLANIAFSKVVFHFPEELNAKVYGSDGRFIPVPMEVDSLELYAGERYSVILYPDQYIQDLIEVEYLRMYEDILEGTNEIPVNIDVSSVSNSSYVVDVFPNPTTGSIKVIAHDDISSIRLRDLNGRVLKEWTNSRELEISEFVAGCYILEIGSGSEVMIQKIILSD